jgi:hypothetical protein
VKERAAAVRTDMPDREGEDMAELQKKHKARAVPAVSAEIAGCMEPFVQQRRRAKSVERPRK